MDVIAPHRARSLAELREIQAPMWPGRASRGSHPVVPSARHGIAAHHALRQVRDHPGRSRTFHTLAHRRRHGFRRHPLARRAVDRDRAGIVGLPTLDGAQRAAAEPRGFKSHLAYDAIPARALKYAVPFRDPKDALVSMYRFMERAGSSSPARSRSSTSRRNWTRQGDGYWKHLVGCRAVRDDPTVLVSHLRGDRSPTRRVTSAGWRRSAACRSATSCWR